MTSGFRWTSTGDPSAILRPKSSTTTLSETCMTSPMWCSTRSTVTARRLVDEEQPRARRERAGQLDALERPERQAGRRMVRDVLEIEEGEELDRSRTDRRLLPGHPAQAKRIREEVAARPAVHADHDVLQDGQRREEREVLEGPADADLGDP